MNSFGTTNEDEVGNKLESFGEVEECHGGLLARDTTILEHERRRPRRSLSAHRRATIQTDLRMIFLPTSSQVEAGFHPYAHRSAKQPNGPEAAILFN